MPSFLESLLGRQLIPNQPNPEPQGFNNMRAAMMQRYFQQMANPYGMSANGAPQGWGQYQHYNPYGGGGMGQGGWGQGQGGGFGHRPHRPGFGAAPGMGGGFQRPQGQGIGPRNVGFRQPLGP